MTHTTKLAAGAASPAITVPRLGGGEIAPAGIGGWRLLIVYRGKHCPRSHAHSGDELPDPRHAGLIAPC